MHQFSPWSLSKEASPGGPSRVLGFGLGLGFLGLLLRFCHVDQWPTKLKEYQGTPYSVAQTGRRVFPDGPLLVADDSLGTARH